MACSSSRSESTTTGVSPSAIGTAIYRYARALAEQQAAASDGVRGWLRHRRAARAQAAMLVPEAVPLLPAQPTEGRDGRAKAARPRGAEFRDARSREPNWAAYGVIPKTVQSARLLGDWPD